MKRCHITLPRDVEGLEEAIRKGMDSDVEFTFEVSDTVDSAEVTHCEIVPPSVSATEGGKEVGTAALIDSAAPASVVKPLSVRSVPFPASRIE